MHQFRINTLLNSGVGGNQFVSTGVYNENLGSPILPFKNVYASGFFGFIHSGNYVGTINTKKINYNISLNDSTILLSGQITGTLPAASIANGYFYNIKNIGTTNVVVTGSNLIDNSGSFSLGVMRAIELQSDGSRWWILGLR